MLAREDEGRGTEARSVRPPSRFRPYECTPYKAERCYRALSHPQVQESEHIAEWALALQPNSLGCGESLRCNRRLATSAMAMKVEGWKYWYARHDALQDVEGSILEIIMMRFFKYSASKIHMLIISVCFNVLHLVTYYSS